MTKFKLTITLLALLMSVGAWADMKPLLNYLDDLGDDVDETSLLYVNYRCLGLMGVVKNVTSKSTRKNHQDMAKSSEEIIKELKETSYVQWTQLREDKSFEAFQENLKISVQPLADNYQRLANENWQNKGTYFAGNELMTSDLILCGQIINRLMTKNENS